LLAETPFDLIITDRSLETPSAGYAVVYAAKTHPKRPAIVVISDYPDLLSRWEKEGADAGLQKPTPVPELLSAIARLLPKRST
jgi:CheY-like chemotaxis protein